MRKTPINVAKFAVLGLGAWTQMACGAAPGSTDAGQGDTQQVTATLAACGAQYTVKSYNPGDVVQNNGTNYQCKPYPFSGWCGISGAYEPGVGFAWQDAWTSLGACGGSSSGGTSTSGGGTSTTTGGGSTTTSSGGSCTAWAAGTNYTTGTVVTYNGNEYIATHDNPGYDPTISTWFWSPDPGASCGGSTGGGSSCAPWVAGTNYTTGTKVVYNGNGYVATHDNPGYDPTISTWFWSPDSSCGGSTGGTTTSGGTTTGGTSGTGKEAVKAGSVPAAYLPWLQKASETCAFLDAPHLAAQIDQESRWDPNAVSSIGAKGLTQFIDSTWAAYGGDANGNGVNSPFDPPGAIMAQGRYMCDLVSQLGGNPSWTTLLWAYNAGPIATENAGGAAPTAEAAQYADLILNQLLPKYTP